MAFFKIEEPMPAESKIFPLVRSEEAAFLHFRGRSVMSTFAGPLPDIPGVRIDQFLCDVSHESCRHFFLSHIHSGESFLPYRASRNLWR
ncbi:unnamed protein product, partial [Notodromas monacha]